MKVLAIFCDVFGLIQFFFDSDEWPLKLKILTFLGLLLLSLILYYFANKLNLNVAPSQETMLVLVKIALFAFIVSLVYCLFSPSPVPPAVAPVSAEFEATSSSATSTEGNTQSPIISFSPNDEDHAEACYSKGISYYSKEDYDAAFPWIEEAAIFGHAKAQYVLGECYRHGHGVNIDEESAFFWYQKSAYQNNKFGLLLTGYCYHHGIGIQQDYYSARDYYIAAHEAGNSDAPKHLAELEEAMAK